MRDIAYVNGEFTDLDKAVISINDRSVQFGDSIYEVLRAHHGEPLYLNEHLARLKSAAGILRYSAEAQIEALPRVIEEGLRRSQHPECLIYLQLTRGIQPRNHIFDAELHSSVIATFRALPQSFGKGWESGVYVELVPDPRHAICHLKTSSLLAHIIVKNEARSKGAFEAIMHGPDGLLHEGCSSSLFIVEGQTLITPPVGDWVLPGVTREKVLRKFAPACGLTVREEAVSTERLFAADEVFLATTSFFVMPVVRVNDKTIAHGTPGAVTRALLAEFNRSLAGDRAAATDERISASV